MEFDGCMQSLHIPYMAPGSIPTDLCVIFKPTKDTMGVYIITRKLKDTDLTGKDCLFGEMIVPPKT